MSCLAIPLKARSAGHPQGKLLGCLFLIKPSFGQAKEGLSSLGRESPNPINHRDSDAYLFLDSNFRWNDKNTW
jgi:hypothetical protein